MKTILKVVLIIAAVLLAGYAADYVYQTFTGIRADLKALQATDEKALALIAEKDEFIQALFDANAVLREKDAVARVERAVLKKERDAARTDLAKALEELKTAPPEALVARASTLLGTDGISLRTNAAAEVEAVFTLPAFRLDVGALEEWHAFKFTLVPNLERALNLADSQLIAVRTERDNLVHIVVAKDAIIEAKDGQIEARDEVIKVVKKKKLWEKVGYVFSFILGLIIGK